MSNNKLKHAAIFAAFAIASGALFHVTVKSMQAAQAAEKAAVPAETSAVDPLVPEEEANALEGIAGTNTLSASSPASDASPAAPSGQSAGGNTVGVIDSDYFGARNEGHIFVKLTNAGDRTLCVGEGEAFAQGVFLPFGLTLDDDADGVRTGGFGSTGSGKQ